MWSLNSFHGLFSFLGIGLNIDLIVVKKLYTVKQSLYNLL